MSETLIFHSQLSSIMEKLVISAVTDINRLVSDYCAAVILKDQLKNRHHSVHQPANEEPQRNTGNNAAGLPVLTQSSAGRCTPAGWRNKAVAATQTEEEPEEDVSFTSSDYKTEVGTIKNERLRGEATSGDESARKAQSCSSPLVSQQQHPAELNMGSPAEWQFHVPPPEGSKEHHTDNQQPMEAQQQLNIAACLDQLGDVGMLIKSEPESIDLEPPSLDQDPSAHLPFQLHPGAMSQMYPDYGACDIPDLSLLRRHASEDGLPGPFGHQTRRDDGLGAPCKVVCEFCGKGFSYQSELKRHAVTHTGERTQHCEQCGKSFIRRSHLLRHKLLHTGFRPFTCPICYRRFSRTSHLERHMKTHLC